ncbi:MAG: hypothetical protein ACPGNV_04280 [Mangrovicoccus sp.]
MSSHPMLFTELSGGLILALLTALLHLFGITEWWSFALAGAVALCGLVYLNISIARRIKQRA